jgi:elongation factor Tu
MAAVDSYIPIPERAIDKPFLMPIEDISLDQAAARLVTGTHQAGICKVGEEMEIWVFATRARRWSPASDVQEAAGRRARGGTTWACCCAVVEKEEVERGQVIAKPGRLSRTRNQRRSVSTVARKKAGGTRRSSRIPPQFYFRTTDVTGVAECRREPRW